MKWLTKYRTLPLFTAAALLFQLLLPFAAVYQASERQGAFSAPLSFGGKIIICTSNGFKLVSLADLLSGKEKPAPHDEYECPLCYLTAHQGIRQRVADLTTAPLPVAARIFFFLPSEAIHSSAAYWRKPSTRAPPALSLV